ncbi:MAG: DUF488 domain-containing protein [Desulfobacterales bacterium]|nr:DUF488 domain-containing protein [Desulfobacterales bacterium]
MKVYTIGYGGRKKEEFLSLLQSHSIKTVADIRLRPDKSSMGMFVKAKTADKGIEKLLSDIGIQYYSFIELGNVFLDFDNWSELYTELLNKSGDLLTRRLLNIPEPFCLLCAEKNFKDCHRQQVAEYLIKTKQAEVIHLN